MFSLNNSFYVPIYWIPQQPTLYHPFLNIFPQTNFVQSYQLTVNSKENANILIQNERQDKSQVQLVDIQVQPKYESQIKRITKNKNFQKHAISNDEIQDNAEKLKRKLANRPKTYQTQKKMYLNQKLQKEQTQNLKRKLRQRKPLKNLKHKRERQNKQNGVIYKNQDKYTLSCKFKKYYCKDKSKIEVNGSQNAEILLNIAVVPLNQKDSQLCYQQRMQKKLDLLSRKFDSN